MISRPADRENVSRDSPTGKFGFTGRCIFSCDDTGAPFDMDHVTLPPGKRNFPHHSHGALWEMYYNVSGTATVRMDEESHTVSAGDSVMCPPGGAQQLSNESNEDVNYLVISDNPPFDCCHYPDSGKTLVRQKIWKQQADDERAFWTRTDETYYTGEDVG